MKGLRIPSATYRLQFNAGFRFEDARTIVPYLHDLGITDIYASPYFKAARGSSHGYDILDQNSLSDEVGTREDYDALCGELQRHDMGQILDIVPNHMCVEGPGNAYWSDLLENGPSSVYAGFFDINWHPVKKSLENKVLIPILGDQYGTVLERQELVLQFEQGAFFLAYYDHRLPIIPRTYAMILEHGLDELTGRLAAEHPDVEELLSIITALRNLPETTATDPGAIAERYREKRIVQRRLWKLYRDSEVIREHIEGNLRTFNGVKGESASFNLLDRLIREQVYRVAYWRVATEEINYRRFFDINALGAIRTEDPQVFQATHRFIFELVRGGKVSGLRVDHADGLADPSEYLARLQGGCLRQICGGTAQDRRRTPRGGDDGRNCPDPSTIRNGYKPFYVIVEKIQMKNEALPPEWQVYGTTGYDFIHLVNGLFVKAANARAFDAIYEHFIGERINFREVMYEKKKQVMQISLTSEMHNLGHYLDRIAERNRHTRDFTLYSLTRSLMEIVACFPVYRTYTNSFEVAERDRQYVEMAAAKAKRKNPATSASVFDFIRDVILLRFPENMDEEDKRTWLDFVMRFQQVTGPVMAKGVEDTAFYVYNRLVSLNEVGSMPNRFGVPLEAFHGQNIERARTFPRGMTATSTHDTKRSEDVRARINVLSEIPEKWRECVDRWSRANARFKTMVDNHPAPDRNEEYLIYQTLVGAWPYCDQGEQEFGSFRQRIGQYLLKAIREAKVNTSWVSPNARHEEAVQTFIDAVLTPGDENGFLPDFCAFQQLTARCGMFNSLSQTLLKIAAPGIPDFYQGTELWDLSLVDPDNRRPVDYEKRDAMLSDLIQRESEVGALALAAELLQGMGDGRVKLYLIYKGLTFRKGQRQMFELGRYIPLHTVGTHAAHLCALERRLADRSVVALAPRFLTALLRQDRELPLGGEVWQDTRVMLPGCDGWRYRNVFTGETLEVQGEGEGAFLAVGEVLQSFPVALLER